MVVQIQNVEGVEDWQAAPEQQLVEKTPAVLIHTSNFSVDHCVFYLELSETALKVLKALVNGCAVEKLVHKNRHRRTPDPGTHSVLIRR